MAPSTLSRPYTAEPATKVSAPASAAMPIVSRGDAAVDLEPHVETVRAHGLAQGAQLRHGLRHEALPPEPGSTVITST